MQKSKRRDSSGQSAETGISAAAADRQPPATNDSPIPGPTKPSQPAKKNLTNSDPPARRTTGENGGGSKLSASRKRSPGNPDRQPRPTSQVPASQPTGDVVSPPWIQFIPSSVAVNRYVRGDLILPPTMDECELQNGLLIYDEMLLDPTIAGCRLWMNVNTLADGLTYEARTFEPAYGQEEVDETDKREADWARRYISYLILDRLQYTDRHIMLALWDLLDGARIPSTIAEVTYGTIRYGEYAGLPGVDYFKTKPRQNYNIVLDTMNKFRGVVSIVPGGSLAKWSGYIYDVSKLPNAIAAEKLVWFYADDRNGIPRSLFNAAFAPWSRMMDFYVDMMQTSGNSAGGKVSVVLGEKAAQQFVDPKTNETKTGEQRAFDSASQWGNNGVLVLSHGSVPNVHYPQGDALSAFILGIRECKREICLALTTNETSIIEGEVSSGLSEDKSSEDAEPVIVMLKSKLCYALDKLSYSILKLAKGEEYAQRYCPVASMKRGDVIDFPDAAKGWAAIATAEGFTPSQIPFISKLIGVPPPTQEEMEVIGATWKAQQEQKVNPPEPVAPGGNAPPNPKKPAPKD